jgi:hypothetical protein
VKQIFIAVIISILGILTVKTVSAQVEEAEQLALDIEKLAQMKSILSEMYKGYQILTTGYNAVKSLAEGNFNLHQTFLSGLLAVSPLVKNYVRVADIISSQATLINEYKTALKNFSGSGSFTVDELNYFSTVYGNLIDRSVDNLDELIMILTDNQLRMNDAERISAIDHLYAEMKDKVSFLRDFNSKAGMIALQRQKSANDIGVLQSLIGK